MVMSSLNSGEGYITPLTDSGAVSGGAKFQQGGFVSGSLLDPGT